MVLKVVLQEVCLTWVVPVELPEASLVQVAMTALPLRRSTDCIRPNNYACEKAFQHVEHGVREAVTKWMAQVMKRS